MKTNYDLNLTLPQNSPLDPKKALKDLKKCEAHYRSTSKTSSNYFVIYSKSCRTLHLFFFMSVLFCKYLYSLHCMKQNVLDINVQDRSELNMSVVSGRLTTVYFAAVYLTIVCCTEP